MLKLSHNTKITTKEEDGLGPWDLEEDMIDMEKSADFSNTEAANLYQHSKYIPVNQKNFHVSSNFNIKKELNHAKKADFSSISEDSNKHSPSFQTRSIQDHSLHTINMKRVSLKKVDPPMKPVGSPAVCRKPSIPVNEYSLNEQGKKEHTSSHSGSPKNKAVNNIHMKPAVNTHQKIKKDNSLSPNSRVNGKNLFDLYSVKLSVVKERNSKDDNDFFLSKKSQFLPKLKANNIRYMHSQEKKEKLQKRPVSPFLVNPQAQTMIFDEYNNSNGNSNSNSNAPGSPTLVYKNIYNNIQPGFTSYQGNQEGISIEKNKNTFSIQAGNTNDCLRNPLTQKSGKKNLLMNNPLTSIDNQVNFNNKSMTKDISKVINEPPSSNESVFLEYGISGLKKEILNKEPRNVPVAKEKEIETEVNLSSITNNDVRDSSKLSAYPNAHKVTKKPVLQKYIKDNRIDGVSVEISKLLKLIQKKNAHIKPKQLEPLKNTKDVIILPRMKPVVID